MTSAAAIHFSTLIQITRGDDKLSQVHNWVNSCFFCTSSHRSIREWTVLKFVLFKNVHMCSFLRHFIVYQHEIKCECWGMQRRTKFLLCELVAIFLIGNFCEQYLSVWFGWLQQQKGIFRKELHISPSELISCGIVRGCIDRMPIFPAMHCTGRKWNYPRKWPNENMSPSVKLQLLTAHVLL